MIPSSESRLFSNPNWVTLTGSEHKKMICSAELESYQKRPVLPLSVTNKLPIKTEHEKMSNLRNLFCMVAMHISEAFLISLIAGSKKNGNFYDFLFRNIQNLNFRSVRLRLTKNGPCIPDKDLIVMIISMLILLSLKLMVTVSGHHNTKQWHQNRG